VTTPRQDAVNECNRLLTSVIFRADLLRCKVITVKRRTAILMLLSFVPLVGCQYDPWADRFLTVEPVEKDVAGTYVIDADSLKRTIKLPMSKSTLPLDRSARVVLSSDHKAEFIHVPEDSLSEGREAGCSVTGRGSWRLSKNDSFSVVLARIVNEEPGSPCKGDFAYELMLYGKRSPYKLHITIGDPDSGDAVQFEKQQ